MRSRNDPVAEFRCPTGDLDLPCISCISWGMWLLMPVVYFRSSIIRRLLIDIRLCVICLLSDDSSLLTCVCLSYERICFLFMWASVGWLVCLFELIGYIRIGFTGFGPYTFSELCFEVFRWYFIIGSLDMFAASCWGRLLFTRHNADLSFFSCGMWQASLLPFLEHFCLCQGSTTPGSRTMRIRVTKDSHFLTSPLSEMNLKICLSCVSVPEGRFRGFAAAAPPLYQNNCI